MQSMAPFKLFSAWATAARLVVVERIKYRPRATDDVVYHHESIALCS